MAQSAPTRVAFVSGAAGGIGRAIAKRLAKDGFNVAVSDIQHSLSALQETAEIVRSFDRKCCITIGDISIRQDVEKAIEQTVQELGRLDVLVANAAVCRVKALIELSTEEFEREISINLTGTFHQYQAAAKQMIKQGGGGKLLATASMAAHRASSLMGAYSCAKFGVRGLTQCAARELAKFNITANAFSPGYVDTEMWGSVDEKARQYTGEKPGEFRARCEQEISLGRRCRPEDVANFVSFLASSDSDYINGQTMLVDGGSLFT